MNVEKSIDKNQSFTLSFLLQHGWAEDNLENRVAIPSSSTANEESTTPLIFATSQRLSLLTIATTDHWTYLDIITHNYAWPPVISISILVA